MHRDHLKSLSLWKKLRDGNLESLGAIYDLYIDELFTYGLQFCGDKSIVMDCIHDLFINLYKYRKNLSQTDRVDFYLMRSLKNILLKRIKILSKESACEDQDNIPNLEKSVEDDIIASEWELQRSQKLNKALKVLSNKQRRGLLLRFTENNSYEEIAELMNISVSSSRTMIYRAIKTLRNQMDYTILAYLMFSTFF